ncbi:MAG: hypothetical protein R3Y07_03070 [Eubacteriales bacterium]
MNNSSKRRGISLGKLSMMALTTKLMTSTVYATDISSSVLATGTQELIADATSWLMVLAPVFAGMMIIYYCIRRASADEMEQKQWTNRITAAVISCIGAVLGAATLQMIVGYYQ